MSKQHSKRERASYWFDNKMAEGFWPKVRLLFIVTLAFVIVMGLLAELVKGPNIGPGEAFVKTLMYALGKGGALTLSGEAGLKDGGVPTPAYFAIMVVIILYCMFFAAMLIGLISNALRSKVEELGKGRSRVLEEGHTLVLGFNEATFVFIEQLIEADRNQAQPQTVVVLGEESRDAMIDQVRKRFGNPRSHPKTRIICRTGSPYDFDDLKRCSIETCRVIVICASSDFEAVKDIMACSHILKEADSGDTPFIVSAIHEEESIIESRIASSIAHGANRVELLSLREVLARIMVHTSRQPGLSDVFTELFDYQKNEFYIFSDDPSFPMLYGKSISEINHYLQMSYAVGVCKPVEGIIIGPPHTTIFEEGDQLIVVKEDDDALQVSEHPARKTKLSPTPTLGMQPVSVIVLGVQPILESVVTEYGQFLEPGSTIWIAGSKSAYETVVPKTAAQEAIERGINIEIRDIDLANRRELVRLLDEVKPDSALVLADQNTDKLEEEDERIIRTLLYLRDYRIFSGKHFSITSEMRRTQNKELAAATEPDDFIISRQFSALLMTQISQNRELATLFNSLLSSNGFEVYMKPASWYVPLGEPIDLISVSESVADRNELFIGIRRKDESEHRVAEINPSKYVSDMRTLRQYTFEEGDWFVLLSEDGNYHAPAE